MEELNGEDSAFVVNCFVKHEDDENSCKWICSFGCKSDPYTGTYSRIRAHLIGLLPVQKSQGVALCCKVTKQEREKMKMEEDEARRIFGGSARRTSVSSALVVRQVDKIATCISVDKVIENCDMYKISSKDKVDGAIARFFYGNGIPFNVAKSPFWVDMVRAINGAPKGYGPPSSEKIKTALLDKEKTKADQALIFIKQQWPTYGVSIVSDGWGNMKDESFMKIMAVSEGKAMLISGIDCLGDDISGEFIAESLLRGIESVGAYGVVQILIDNIPSCKAADKIIETAYPHIFWSGCMAHTLSLLLKDVIKSTNAALDFVSKCYQQEGNHELYKEP